MDLKYILASCVGMETECDLTLSSPRLPAEVRRWVLQLKLSCFLLSFVSLARLSDN